MSRARTAILVILGVGVIVGVVGGIVFGHIGFNAGLVVFAIGLLILYMIAVWKRPEIATDMESDPLHLEKEPLNITEAERLISRNNRGTIPRAK